MHSTKIDKIRPQTQNNKKRWEMPKLFILNILKTESDPSDNGEDGSGYALS